MYRLRTKKHVRVKIRIKYLLWYITIPSYQEITRVKQENKQSEFKKHESFLTLYTHNVNICEEIVMQEQIYPIIIIFFFLPG